MYTRVDEVNMISKEEASQGEEGKAYASMYAYLQRERERYAIIYETQWVSIADE